jgi:hypothetical protein
MFADLHLHSHFSDGTFAPEEIVARGHKSGFAALALTDHDTVEGCARMAAACDAAGIEFITGSELTAEHKDTELHILGYFLDATNEKLRAELARFQVVRQNRIREIVARLNELKVPLQADEVLALANCNSPGRPHVARSLVKGGHCKSSDEAFEHYLKKNRPAWVPKAKLPAADAIELIHQAGGLAVMAHPGLNRADDLIPDLVAAGLDGLECYHTKHSNSVTRRYLEMAEKLNLLVTGGSDCHGKSKGKPLIGTVKLDYVHVEKLKAARNTPHSALRIPH